MVSELSGADLASGVSSDHGPFGHGLEDGGPCSGHGAVGQGDARADEGLGGHPHAVAQGDGPGHQGHHGRGDVVRGGAEEAALAHHGVVADGDGGLVVQLHAGAYGAAAQRQLPGREDLGRLVDLRLRVDAGAEQAQQGVADAPQLRAGQHAEQGGVDDAPHYAAQSVRLGLAVVEYHVLFSHVATKVRLFLRPGKGARERREWRAGCRGGKK